MHGTSSIVDWPSRPRRSRVSESCLPSPISSSDQRQEAKAWYRRFDFEESPTDPLQLLLLLDDLRREIE
jgi:hypothetical protein